MFSKRILSCALSLMLSAAFSFAQDQQTAASTAQTQSDTVSQPVVPAPVADVPAAKAPVKKKVRRPRKKTVPVQQAAAPSAAQPQTADSAAQPAAQSASVDASVQASAAVSSPAQETASPVVPTAPVPAKKKVRRPRKKAVPAQAAAPVQDNALAQPSVPSQQVSVSSPVQPVSGVTAQPDAASSSVSSSTAPVAAAKPLKRSTRARRPKKPATGKILPIAPPVSPVVKAALGTADEPLPPVSPAALAKSPEPVPLDGLNLKFSEAESGMNIYVRFAGTTTAEDLYDVTAPFDGKSKNVKAELFQWVEKGDVLGSLVSEEMMALLNSSSSERSRKETERKWKEIYDMSPVKAPEAGIIVGMEMKEDGSFYEGDRLFLLARKIFIIAKTTNRLYVPLKLDLEGEVRTQDGIKARAVVRKFLPTGVEGQFLMRLEVVSKNKGLQPGMTFQGEFALLERPGVAAVPTDSIVTKDGKQYALTLTPVETGLRDEKRTEVTKGLKGGEILVLPSSIGPLEGK